MCSCNSNHADTHRLICRHTVTIDEQNHVVNKFNKHQIILYDVINSLAQLSDFIFRDNQYLTLCTVWLRTVEKCKHCHLESCLLLFLFSNLINVRTQRTFSHMPRKEREREKNVRKQKMWSIPQSIFKYLCKTSKFGSIFSLFISIPSPYTPNHMILITSVAGKIKLCLMFEFVRTRLYLHILFKCVCVCVCLFEIALAHFYPNIYISILDQRIYSTHRSKIAMAISNRIHRTHFSGYKYGTSRDKKVSLQFNLSFDRINEFRRNLL